MIFDSVDLLQKTLIKITKRELDEGRLTPEQHEEILLMPMQDLDELELAYYQFQYYVLGNRILKGAEFLEQPNLRPELYKAGMDKYDRLCDMYMDVQRKLTQLRRETA